MNSSVRVVKAKNFCSFCASLFADNWSRLCGLLRQLFQCFLFTPSRLSTNENYDGREKMPKSFAVVAAGRKNVQEFDKTWCVLFFFILARKLISKHFSEEALKLKEFFLRTNLNKNILWMGLLRFSQHWLSWGTRKNFHHQHCCSLINLYHLGDPYQLISHTFPAPINWRTFNHEMAMYKYIFLQLRMSDITSRFNNE